MVQKLVALSLVVMLLAGCSSLGPKTVVQDRFDYNAAISNSWKEQTLLNIVKLRYADMPLFVEVTSVVSGYSLESQVNLGGTVSSTDAIQGDFFNLGASGKYTDRPTITYAPITGQKFNKSFMTPLPPGSVLFLTQSGWPVDMVFPITVDSINNLRSTVHAGANKRTGDTGFYRVITLLRQMQKSGAVGMKILAGQEDSSDKTVLLLHKDRSDPKARAALLEMGNLLQINPDADEVNLTYGSVPSSNSELAILTRSMMQIMVLLATQIDVPQEHVEEGRTAPSMAHNADNNDSRLIDIKATKERPEYAFVAVKYRDYWFWIDDRDFKSKRTFAFLMILFSLTESGGKEGLPLVTIPAI